MRSAIRVLSVILPVAAFLVLSIPSARADDCGIFQCWPPSAPKGAMVVRQDLDAELPGAVSREPQANAALAADKAIAASCADCYWAAQQECIVTGESCSSAQTDQCGPRNGWPGEESWTRWVIYFAQPPPAGAGNYSPVGDFCAPGGGGVSVEGVRAAFRGLGWDVPGVNYQPGWGTLVNLATRFWTPAPAGYGGSGFVDGMGWGMQERVVTVGGVAVTITPHVRWVWDFGDGGGGTFYVPGAPYPDTGVNHVYASPAAADTVTVTAQYTATYRYAGHPDANLGVVVERVSPARGIAVMTARAQLTDPNDPWG